MLHSRLLLTKSSAACLLNTPWGDTHDRKALSDVVKSRIEILLAYQYRHIGTLKAEIIAPRAARVTCISHLKAPQLIVFSCSTKGTCRPIVCRHVTTSRYPAHPALDKPNFSKRAPRRTKRLSSPQQLWTLTACVVPQTQKNGENVHISIASWKAIA